MKRTLMAIVGLVSAMQIAAAQATKGPSIQLRKVRTLTDRDDKGFTRAPMSAVPLSNGRFALAEMNELPLVVDSTGRLLKRWPLGQGPGEFETNAGPLGIGQGDTLYVGNHSNLNVFDRNLKFVRSIPLSSIYAGSFVPIEEGLLVAAGKFSGQTMTSMHVVSPTGKVIRSFLTDTVVRSQRAPPPEYRVGRGAGNTFWAWSIWGHRLERWTLAGERTMIIDTTPAWFPQQDPLYKARVSSVREVDGVLWVFTSVPVPNARELALAPLKDPKIKKGGEMDARRMPFEQLSTSHLEVYDAATGKLLADTAIKSYGVTILDDRHVMLYTTGPNDEAQLEIWEMKLKRR